VTLTRPIELRRPALRCRAFLRRGGAAVLLAGAVAAVPSAHADGVFRCTVDGKVTYSDNPCAGVDSRKVDVTVSAGYAPVPPPPPPASASPGAPTQVPPDPNAAPAPATGETLGAAGPDADADLLKRQCVSLEKQRKRNENAARAPNTPRIMEMLSDEHRRIEDQLRELKC